MTDDARAALDGDPEGQAWITRRLQVVILDDIRPSDRWSIAEKGRQVLARWQAARLSGDSSKEHAS